tara:strand:- start:48 stop:614 length:567 start_codon:yes stop_codon:yes gene_type:complete
MNGLSRAADANKATMLLLDNSLTLAADGYIGGIEMTLSHGTGFEIELSDQVFIAEYKTVGTSTRLVVIEPSEDCIFTTSQSFEIIEMMVVNSTEEIAVDVVSEFRLSAAYPNPFNPSTTVSLTVPTAGHVSVKVYNLIGQEIGVLSDGMLEANVYAFTWNASNMPSGLYLIKAESSTSVAVQKVLLVK